jgi:hypothetical protein
MSDIAVPQPTVARARVYLAPGRESSSFADLVRARWLSTPECDPEAHDLYLDTLRRFERDHGEIVDDYWSENEPAAVAVTCRRRFLRRKQLTLHRRTERLSAGRPGFARLLLGVDRQAVRASNVLAGMGQRIAMCNLYSLTREVTTYLDAHHGENVDHEEALASYERELEGIADYADQAAARQAQIIFLHGMMFGLFMLFVFAVGLAFAFSGLDVPGVEPTLFVACLVAGSFGAAMSVLIRMSNGKFAVNHEIGREYVARFGFVRPFIGAIFALLLFFAFRGELLQQVDLPAGPQGELAFFVASGFLIGFSERFAKEIVRAAQPPTGTDRG